MKNLEQIKETYDYLNTQGYGGSFHGRKHTPFLKLLNINSVLDVGTGQGQFCNWAIEELCSEVHGLDISIDPNLEFLNKNIDFLKGCSHDIPLEDKSVDLTTSFDFLEHVHPDFLDRTIDEMVRVTRKCMFHTTHGGPSHSRRHHEIRPGVEVGELHLIQEHKKHFWIKKIFNRVSDSVSIVNGGILVIFSVDPLALGEEPVEVD